jgi:hypothetical protein
MNETDKRHIERLEYWQGQLLRSSDFRAQVNADNQLRWWHNRALHDAYGVSLGLKATESVDGLRISCGLAYDCEGRELLLGTTVLVAPPEARPAAGPLLLLLRMAADEPVAHDLVACGPCSTSESQVELVWIGASRVDGRKGVPLARLVWSAAGLPRLDSAFEPPRSRPIARPHLGSGMTPPDGTVWEAWMERVSGSASPTETLGLQTRVDTSAAGFARIPVYTAQLNSRARTAFYFVPPPICHIAEAAPESFVFRIWMPRVQIAGQIPLKGIRAKIRDVGDEGATLSLFRRGVFLKGDRVRRVGGTVVATVTNVNEDGNIIKVEPALADIVGGEDSIRLDHLASLDRVAPLVEDVSFLPGMEVQIEGTILTTQQPFSRRFTVSLAENGALSFTPSGIPPLVIGDKTGEGPRITVVGAHAVDLGLVVQNLGWHVCWLGSVCEGRPTVVCPDIVCKRSAKEVC